MRTPSLHLAKNKAITGCILGTAVGDALGLPYEGLSAAKASRMFKNKDQYHFLFNRGMVSDDTEHTCMVAEALIASAGDVEKFSKELARRLRYWLLGLPAGVGFATLRSILKLWIGISPAKSGVFSAGNGPAMRSAIIGVCYGSDEAKLKELVRASTSMTHTDPKAYYGAIAVAIAAHENAFSSPIDGTAYYHRLEQVLADQDTGEFLNLINNAVQSAKQGHSTQEFVKSLQLDKGITGYIYHTVPVVIHVWLLYPGDFRSALMDIINCGGDTDTTGAILGAIVGSAVGKEGIPEMWLQHLIEWPRTVSWMERLGCQLGKTLEDDHPVDVPTLPVWGIALRNLVFMVIVLLHGFRRLLPKIKI